jgi:protein O-mannosyl-transferase
MDQISNIEMPPQRTPRWRVAAICLALAAISFAVFGQTLRHEFVSFDDDDYVYENPVVAQGLTFKGVVWAFTGSHAHNWHPLTWLSHMLDCQLYGLHPGGHHLTNVLLHTATAIALFLVLRQMTGVLWRSAFVAAVFAIHPLRVESVAWVAERKDVLSGLFFMLTIGAYVRYARRPWSWGRYGLVLLLFAMGLMCKPMLVTLPVVLLLLDYWPLQRKEPARKLVMEKLPLLALSAVSCVATLLAQTELMQSTAAASLPLRLANAVVACLVYLRQMVWPAGLAVIYPYPLNGLPAWEVALAVMLLGGLSLAAFWQWRTRPWILFGWLWYLVMLLPVVGIIQVGNQPYADRYTYLPQIGIYVAVTWLAADWRAGRSVFAGLMAGVVAVLMVCAWKQAAYWQDSETLWNHTLACTTGNDMAHFGLGNVFLKSKRWDDAIAQYQEAMQIHSNFGEVYNNLGYALQQKGRADEAIPLFQKALELNPNIQTAYDNLGTALLQKGRMDEALAVYQAALRINPDNAKDHYILANLLRQKGKLDEAIGQYQQALQIDPNYVEAQNNLGLALWQNGREADAIAEFQKTVQIAPNNASYHLNLAKAFMLKGRMSDAINQYQMALQIEPANLQTQNDLAWLLATGPQASLRNGEKALQLAQHANAVTGEKNPIVLHTLAAALAATGRFGDAAQTAQKAIELARAAGQKDLAAQLNDELKRYQAKLPLQ